MLRREDGMSVLRPRSGNSFGQVTSKPACIGEHSFKEGLTFVGYAILMRRLDGLDTLRGIAAICVALYHMSAINVVTQRLAGGYLAVDFFFVLSGYVMARSFERRKIAGLSFLRSRLLRLWPTMAIGVMLGSVVHSDDPRLLWFMIAGLLFLPLFVTDQAFPINNAAWSVFFELTANVIHAAVLSRLHTRWLSVFVGLLAIAAVPSILQFGGLKPGPYSEAFVLGLPRTLLSYCLGIVLYRKWKDRPPIAIPFVVTIALLPVMLCKPFSALGLAGWYDLVFVIAVCPLLMAGGLRHATAWGSALGTISFPLYAVHYPIMTLSYAAHLPPMVGLLSAIAIATGLAYGSRFLRRLSLRELSLSTEAKA